MARTSFTGIPTEIRVKVFEHLFQNARVTVTRNKEALVSIKKSFHDDILYTCKKTYDESRSVLASILIVNFRTGCSDDVTTAVRSFYYPRIRTIIMNFTGNQPFDASSFIALRELHIDHQPSSRVPTCFGVYKSTTVYDVQHGLAYSAGALDSSLKGIAQSKYLKENNSAWIKDILESRKSVKVIASAIVVWSMGQDGDFRARSVGVLVSGSQILSCCPA